MFSRRSLTRGSSSPIAALAAALLIGALPRGASAEPATDADPAPGQWEFSAAPYLWASSMEGTVTAGGVESDFDASFSDILDQLDIGLLAAFEARKDRFSFTSNLVWMDLSADGSKPVGPPIIGAVLDVDVEVRQIMLEGVAGYEVLSRRLGAGSDHRRVSVDLRSGLRYWYFDSDIEVTLGPGKRSFGDSYDWVDLVAGARAHVDLAERLRLTVTGDVGGFSLGSSSDSTWSITGILAYEISPSWRLVGGWRELDVDRDLIDFRLSGPLLGAIHRF